MLRLYNEEKLNLTAIGEKFSLSRERVRQILKRAGYTPRPGGFPRVERESNVYTVKIVRTQTKYVEIEAYNAREARVWAKEIARLSFDDGLPMKTVVRATVSYDPADRSA
jgi:hypothetical protein